MREVTTEPPLPETFDSAAARRFADQDDRDEAWFFAGRDAERQAFAAAARQAHEPPSDGGRPRAVFRIFQGAPGCGKTSFVRRMETERRDLLFVLADEQHLTDAGALMYRIAQEALNQDKGANIVSGLAVAALEASRMKTAAQAIAKEARDRATRQADLVIWVDEAQTIDRTYKALPSAHRGGLGVPALVVLSGLPVTARNVRSIPGLSRLADAAIVEMGTMANEECATSTRMMLDAYGVTGPRAAANEAAARVAAMAYGWPQHLKTAQKALTEALLAANGTQRLDNGMPADDPALAIAIIAKLGAGFADQNMESMVDLVRDQAKTVGSRNRSKKAARQFLDDLIRHGVLIRRRSPANVVMDRWTVAVPSMAAWAEEALPLAVASR